MKRWQSCHKVWLKFNLSRISINSYSICAYCNDPFLYSYSSQSFSCNRCKYRAFANTTGRLNIFRWNNWKVSHNGCIWAIRYRFAGTKIIEQRVRIQTDCKIELSDLLNKLQLCEHLSPSIQRI